ncbi:MAG TPA: bifunctional phosphoserine phosphatase/homoserine phosphotransferase ThrH [Spirochaetia bacterium]|nr:bifunctional phosphoserine phosphatase/homoserine phosphotransferase ThrH [Spirochaetia bacterium]
MHLVCLDLEGVLVPEIWIAFAEATRINELRLTTRDISDYDQLMKHRIAILRANGLRLGDIQEVIAGLSPLDGALAFLGSLREMTQVIILSDTFSEFASPLMRTLGWPTLFCNSLVVSPDGSIEGYTLRQKEGKRRAVEALQSIGYTVVAAGDSYNDLSMLKQADRGVLFRAPDSIRKEFSDFPAVDEYAELLDEISSVLQPMSARRNR